MTMKEKLISQLREKWLELESKSNKLSTKFSSIVREQVSGNNRYLIASVPSKMRLKDGEILVARRACRKDENKYIPTRHFFMLPVKKWEAAKISIIKIPDKMNCKKGDTIMLDYYIYGKSYTIENILQLLIKKRNSEINENAKLYKNLIESTRIINEIKDS